VRAHGLCERDGRAVLNWFVRCVAYLVASLRQDVKTAKQLLARRYLCKVRSLSTSCASGYGMSAFSATRLMSACAMFISCTTPNRCPCLMSALHRVAICRNATTRRAASIHVSLSPPPRQYGARWAAHGRQTAAMRRAPWRQSRRRTLLPSSISSSGSPTTLPMQAGRAWATPPSLDPMSWQATPRPGGERYRRRQRGTAHNDTQASFRRPTHGPASAGFGLSGPHASPVSAAHVYGADGALCRCARQVHSLQQKPEQNGAEGEVLEFDASAGRWKVQLHREGLVLALNSTELNGAQLDRAQWRPRQGFCAPGSWQWAVGRHNRQRRTGPCTETSQPGPDQEARADGAAAYGAGGAERRAGAPGDKVKRAASGGRLAGIAALERAALALARDLRGAHPDKAGAIHSVLGMAYVSLGDFSKVIKYHTQRLAIAKEVGDRAGEGWAYANLGNAYKSLGDYAKAIKYHTQHLAIAREVGDRAGEGVAYRNLGNAYKSQGGFSKAIKYHTQDLAIAKEVGDRAGEGGAYGNLGAGHLYLNETKPSPTSKHTCLGNIAEACTRAVPCSAEHGWHPHPSRPGRLPGPYYWR
jgi:tetratricopeptide (TPR) repeat protein